VKIAFVVDRFPSLSETFVLHQITWLLQAGHDVRIFAAKASADPVAHPDVVRFGLIERTRYARSFNGGHHTRQLQLGSYLLSQVALGRIPAGQVLRGLERSGGRSLPVWTYPRGDGEFDAVVAHFGPNGVHALEMRKAGVLHGPLVTVFHGYDMNPARPAVRRGYDRLFAEGDLFLPISEYFRRRLLGWGAPEGRTLVHHMGVDPSQFELIQRPVNGRLRVLSIARLVAKKGIEFGIRAAALLGDHIEYTIIGDGPERHRLEALIRSLAVAERVTLAGWKTQDEVTAALRSAHLLLAPSVTTDDGEEEGIPVALMEGMAAGLPVVSTRHSGIPELVQDGVSGYLVAERSAAQLADRLTRVLTGNDTAASMGRAGRLIIERSFNSGLLHPRLLSLLDSLQRPVSNNALTSRYATT
jgi:colanic acid/amylovoran biosynthesis glycosyltransferase